MKAQLYYTIEVRDREGKLLKRLARRKSKSYVEQWNRLIHWMAQASDQDVIDIEAESRELDRDTGGALALRMDGAEATPNMGPVVGTGSTAVAITDRELETIIAHGTGAGEMFYYAATVGAPSVSAPDCSFTLTRVIGNQSEGAITVAEIGIHCSAQDTGATSRYFLIVRDVLASSVEVPDGGAITVVYTIKVTV